jgi:hypothetical protein
MLCSIMLIIVVPKWERSYEELSFEENDIVSETIETDNQT